MSMLRQRFVYAVVSAPAPPLKSQTPRPMHWANADGTIKLPQEFLNQNFAHESSASGYQDAPVHVHFPDAIFVGIVRGDGCHFVGVYLGD